MGQKVKGDQDRKVTFINDNTTWQIKTHKSAVLLLFYRMTGGPETV